MIRPSRERTSQVQPASEHVLEAHQEVHTSAICVDTPGADELHSSNSEIVKPFPIPELKSCERRKPQPTRLLSVAQQADRLPDRTRGDLMTRRDQQREP